MLYEWANDPAVRNNSFNSAIIPYENHVKWFHHIMDDEKVIQFVLMDSTVPVGQIRLTIDNDLAEIGYSIAADYRGKGYGHRILQLVAQEVNNRFPQVTKLIAKVKPENIASLKLFENEGYAKAYSCYTLDIVNKG